MRTLIDNRSVTQYFSVSAGNTINEVFKRLILVFKGCIRNLTRLKNT